MPTGGIGELDSVDCALGVLAVWCYSGINKRHSRKQDATSQSQLKATGALTILLKFCELRSYRCAGVLRVLLALLGLRGCLTSTSCGFLEPLTWPPTTYVNAGALFSLLVAEPLTERGACELKLLLRLLRPLLGRSIGVWVPELDCFRTGSDVWACHRTHYCVRRAQHQLKLNSPSSVT